VCSCSGPDTSAVGAAITVAHTVTVTISRSLVAARISAELTRTGVATGIVITVAGGALRVSDAVSTIRVRATCVGVRFQIVNGAASREARLPWRRNHLCPTRNRPRWWCPILRERPGHQNGPTRRCSCSGSNADRSVEWMTPRMTTDCRTALPQCSLHPGAKEPPEEEPAGFPLPARKFSVIWLAYLSPITFRTLSTCGLAPASCSTYSPGSTRHLRRSTSLDAPGQGSNTYYRPIAFRPQNRSCRE